jgi:RimJ/RimL family protein N-acetyltransferase
MAETWIGTHESDRQAGKQFVYAVCDRTTGALMGSCGLVVNPQHQVAELGYWLGFLHWGHGYMTEAARVVMTEGFASLPLRRIYARHFDSNPASGRVMAKLGMQREGVLRQHITKWDVPLDLVYWGVLREEFIAEW